MPPHPIISKYFFIRTFSTAFRIKFAISFSLPSKQNSMRVIFFLPVCLLISFFSGGGIWAQQKGSDLYRANKLIESEKYSEALDVLNEKIRQDSAQNHTNQIEHSQAYELKAKAYESLSQAMDASLAFKNALIAARKTSFDDIGIQHVSKVLLNFGEFYFRYHYYNQAKDHVRQSFASLDTQQTRDLKGIANILVKGGKVLWKSGSLAESENWLVRANQILKDSLKLEKEELLRPQILLACIHTSRGKYKLAEPVLKESMPELLRASSLDDETYREGLYYRAKLLAETGRYTQALVELTDLLDFLKVHEPNLVEASRLTAELYARTGDFKPALELAEKTRFRYEEEIAYFPELYIYSYASLLNLYYASGDSASAEKYYEYASLMTRKSLGKDHPVYAWILGEKGLFLLKIGRFKDAMIHLNKSAQIWDDKTGVQSIEYGLSLYRLGYANAYIGRFNKAQPYFLKALDIFKNQLTPEHPYYCRTMDETAELYTLVARYEEAEKYLKELPDRHAERMSDAEADATEIPYSLTRLGRLYTLKGEFAQADSLLTLAFTKSKGLKGYNQFYKAKILEEKSRLNYAKGNYSQSLVDIQEASHILLSMPFRGKLPDVFQKRNQVAYAECLTRKGLGLSAQGKYYEASENLLKALDIFKAYQGEDYIPFAEALAGLARINFQLGYYTQAERQSQRSKEIVAYVAGEFHPSYGESLRLHGDILLALGRLDEAARQVVAALQICKDRLGEKHPQYARLLSDLAYIRFFQGEKTQAIEGQRQALNILKSNASANPALLSRTEIRLAMILQADKSYATAQVVLIQSIARLEKSTEPYQPLLAEAMYLNGILHLEQAHWEESENWLKKSFAIKSVLLPENHPDLLMNKVQQALVIWKQGRITEANTYFESGISNYFSQARKYFSGMSEMERARYFQRIQPYLQLYGNFVALHKNELPNAIHQLLTFQLEAKGILLHESSLIKAQITRSGNDDLQRTYQEWADLSGQLARFGIINENNSTSEVTSLQKLQEDILYLEKDLSRKSEYANSLLNQNKPNWENIQASLLAGEAAVEIIRSRNQLSNQDSGEYIGIILLPGKTEPKIIRLGNASWAESGALINYRRSILNKIADPFSYETYWKAIESELNGARKVFLCPDGVYHFLNPETFLRPDNQYISESVQILRVSNLREIHNLDPSFKNASEPSLLKEAMIIGNPDFYLDRNTLTRTNPMESLPDLPNTLIETKAIKDLLAAGEWKCTLLTGMQATEQAVRLCKSPSILHLATHGYFIPESNSTGGRSLPGMEGAWLARNPMLRSGLLLTGSASTLSGYNTSPDEAEDGILTALEVMTMDLSGTDLVVLSACETGLGELQAGEGLLGLQRGFRIAGANSVLMTLWNISDAVTSEVMSYFYTNFLKGGSHSDALRATIQEIRKKYPDPYYWGGFVLNGQ